MSAAPKRIVCLSAEAADWMWRIGAWDSVVGVTTFFEPPPRAPLRPRVSGFSSANLEQIAKLKPDLVITFSDVQAGLAAECIRRGINVLATNQRSLVETEATLALLARVVDREQEGAEWLTQFNERLAPATRAGARARVYFEEWNDPLITGIAWVSELIERAGGEDVFAATCEKRAAIERVVTSEGICEANPEIIFASWCGKPVDVATIVERPGWSQIAAVQKSHVCEIPAADILQPGFRLVRGYQRIKHYLQNIPCDAALSH